MEARLLFSVTQGIAAFGGTAGTASNIPTLTKTSSSTANPLTWSASYPNAVVFDGTDGTKVDMQWRVNGGAWNADTRQALTSDVLLSGSFTWTLFAAITTNAGDFVEAQEREVPYIAGVAQTPSGWSNTVSDTYAVGTAFDPATLYGVGDIGYVWDTTDLTHIWQSNAGTGAGAFTSPVGRIDDKSGLGNNWNSDFNLTDRPTLANTNNGLMTFTAGSNTRLKNIGGFYAKGKLTWIGVVKAAASSNFIWAETSTSSTAPVYAPGLRGNNSTQMLNEQKNDAGTQLATAMACALLDGAIHVYMIEDTGTVLTLWLDGTQTASAAYSRNAPLTTNSSWLGVADVAGTFFGPMTVSIGSGITISRQLTGTLGTAGTEKTKAYNWIAAKHGLTQL